MCVCVCKVPTSTYASLVGNVIPRLPFLRLHFCPPSLPRSRHACHIGTRARTAGVFFDVLRQFGEPDEEMSRRRMYCKWKASEILKAIKEGRAPTPGGAGEDVSAREFRPTL